MAKETPDLQVLPAAPTRVGVILAAIGKLNVTALKYLVVHLNTLQTSLEFEILSPNQEDELLVTLGNGKIVDRDKCRLMLPDFRERMNRFIAVVQKAYDLADESAPQNFVVISLAKFSDEHYGLKENHVQIQALGNWARHMAPPSILEFIVALLMRQAAGFVVPTLSKSLHLCTKGCLFDFTSDLTEARYKALQSFVCSTCRSRIQESGAVHLADDITRVLDFNWLGIPSDPHCPAGIRSQAWLRSLPHKRHTANVLGKYSFGTSRRGDEGSHQTRLRNLACRSSIADRP